MFKFNLLFLFLIFGFTSNCQISGGVFISNSSIKQKSPLIAGHKGGFDSELPENSIALFDYTITNSCVKQPVIIEMDLRESADGCLYLMHDPIIDRTTNGTGNITQLKVEYIKSLFLKDKMGKLTGEKIPLFAEVLTFFQNKNAMLLLDVKGNVWLKVLNFIKQAHMERSCIILTFKPEDTKLVSQNSDKVMISALVTTSNEWLALEEIRMPLVQTIIYISDKTKSDLIKRIRHTGVFMMTDMNECLKNNSQPYEVEKYKKTVKEKHLDILITDFPVLVSKAFCDK